MAIRYIAAVDLGASSGRVILSAFDTRMQTIKLSEIHRFTNQLVHSEGHDCWDLDYLEQEILKGLFEIDHQGITLDSIGIDTWGVDYVLLDKNGQRVGPSYAYRDHRTHGVMSSVQQELGLENIYQRTGIQFLPFNSLYQLKAMVAENPPWLSQVTDFVMIPDYLIYRLTGKLNREYTNATTSQLVNIDINDWDQSLLDYLGLPKQWFGEIRHPGNEVGFWLSPSGAQVKVISVASHDTASAVIAAPLTDQHSAYLCSGTWSLMGLDSKEICRCETAFSCNITNEGGIDGHYRVLKNIMGLWLFQRICQEHQVKDIALLVSKAAKEPAFTSIIQPNDERFLNPESMTKAIQSMCQESQQPIPQTIEQLTRCVFDSLALLYRQVSQQLAALHKHPLQQMHVVGGGCQNDFLNQLCADVCGLKVTAGPVESSTLGNVGCQLMTLNEVEDVKQFRQLISNNFPLKEFNPQPNFTFDNAWRVFCALN